MNEARLWHQLADKSDGLGSQKFWVITAESTIFQEKKKLIQMQMVAFQQTGKLFWRKNTSKMQVKFKLQKIPFRLVSVSLKLTSTHYL